MPFKDDMNRISDLPEPLKEKILLALSTKDAIRMSFSSKHWQNLWNSRWNSLPVTRFNLEDSTFTDEYFRSSFPEHEGQKRIVQFLLEDLIVVKKMTHSDVDWWIKMVTQHYVTELKLFVESTHSHGCVIKYQFPPASFDVGSLVELRLTNCMLDQALIQKDTIFCSLKSLTLWNVYLHGLLGELLSRCPLLESLEFTGCEKLPHLELCDVPNLRNVVIVHLDDTYVHTLKIQAPNLESLVYQEPGWERALLNLEEVCCRNLRKLCLDREASWIGNKYIEEVVQRFPILEELVLYAEKFTPEYDYETYTSSLKISSRSLAKLKMIGETDDADIIIVDAPNLVSYKHNNYRVPRSILIESSKLEKHTFCLVLPDMDTVWFFNLRSYLGGLSPEQAGSSVLKIYCPQRVEFEISKNLRSKANLPWPKVKELVLQLESTDPSGIYPEHNAAFIDGLLWSCQPMQIRVQLSPRYYYVNNFITFIYEKLIDVAGKPVNPHCCRKTRVKCWEHYLSSVTLESFIIMKEGKRHCYNNENSTMDLSDLEEASEATFALQWFTSPKKQAPRHGVLTANKII